ncbi:glycosyltransferase [Desulfovibrionales bacterium]
MNICFVNATHKWGGVKSWTVDVASGLAERGHTLLVAGRPGPFLEKSRARGLETLELAFGPDFNPVLIARLVRLFAARNIDLVVVNVGKDMRAAGVAAGLLGIPVIHRVGLAGDMRNTWKVRLMHRLVRPRILVPCQQIRDGLLQELPYIKPQDITVILTGKTPVPAPPTTVHTPVRCISTSQLNPDKGHADVLTALAQLKTQGHDFLYHIVGTGSSEAELKALGERLHLEDHLVWHGFQTDVPALLRQADVFLLPSYSEGLPNALLEAMAQGLVCVARDVGGVREVWPESAPDLLLSAPATAQDWAATLAHVLTCPGQDLARLRAAFWSVACAHTVDDMTARVENMMRSMLNKERAA